MIGISRGKALDLATIPNTCMIYGVYVVRYNNIPIIDLYMVRFTIGVSYSLHNLQPLRMGVLTILQYSVQIYLDFLTTIWIGR